MTVSKLPNEKIIELLKSDKPINKARTEFSSSAAAIEQASMQRKSLNPIEMRRMQFNAVEKITQALGVNIPGNDLGSVPALRFMYKDLKGETRERKVRPLGFDYTSNELYPEEQWFLVCIDIDTNEKSFFALKDIKTFLT